MPKRNKTKRRKSSQKKGRLNLVKDLMKDKNVRELIVQIIRIIIETMKR